MVTEIRRENRVHLPDGATLQLEVAIFIVDDPTATIRLTVHRVDGMAVGNVWIRNRRVWRRFLEEKTFETESDCDVLGKELQELQLDHVLNEWISTKSFILLVNILSDRLRDLRRRAS